MERFFYRCLTIRETAGGVKEFVFRTYQGAADEIFRLPWREAEEIVTAGREESQKSDFWLMYCNIYPFMTDDTFVTFEDWYEGLKHKPQKSEKTVTSIMADVNNIIGMTLSGGQNGITV